MRRGVWERAGENDAQNELLRLRLHVHARVCGEEGYVIAVVADRLCVGEVREEGADVPLPQTARCDGGRHHVVASLFASLFASLRFLKMNF